MEPNRRRSSRPEGIASPFRVRPLPRPGDDPAYTGGGNDEIYGDEGNDICYGGYADNYDYIEGGDGSDNMFGETGADRFFSPSDGYYDFIDGGADSSTDTVLLYQPGEDAVTNVP